MAKPGGLTDRGVNWVIHHLSNFGALALGVLLYPGFGLVLPLSLGLSTYYVVLCNLVGVVLALVVVLAWTGVIFDTAERRHLIDWTTELRHLNSTEFEWLVGEVFRREGWTVQETGRVDGPDGNIDLVLNKPGTRIIVQCKRWEAEACRRRRDSHVPRDPVAGAFGSRSWDLRYALGVYRSCTRRGRRRRTSAR